MIGPHADVAKEIKVLGRVISYHPWGIQYEADPNHLEIALKAMGLEGRKAVVTPWVKETTMSALERNARDARRGGAVLPCRVQEAEEDLDGDTPRDPAASHRYMSVSARLNFGAMNQTRIM